MVNSWITYVKAYAKKNNISYSVALKKAGASYKKGGATTKKVVAKVTKVKSTAKGKKAKGKVARPRVSDAYEANQSLVKKLWRAKSNASLVGRNDVLSISLLSSMSHASNASVSSPHLHRPVGTPGGEASHPQGPPRTARNRCAP